MRPMMWSRSDTSPARGAYARIESKGRPELRPRNASVRGTVFAPPGGFHENRILTKTGFKPTLNPWENNPTSVPKPFLGLHLYNIHLGGRLRHSLNLCLCWSMLQRGSQIAPHKSITINAPMYEVKTYIYIYIGVLLNMGANKIIVFVF